MRRLLDGKLVNSDQCITTALTDDAVQRLRPCHPCPWRTRCYQSFRRSERETEGNCNSPSFNEAPDSRATVLVKKLSLVVISANPTSRPWHGALKTIRRGTIEPDSLKRKRA